MMQLLVLLALGLGPQATPQSAAPPETPLAFVVEYADGRTTRSVIGRSNNVSWTPKFPRVDGAAASKDGLPLAALQFEHVVDGRSLQTTIALLYGSPHQHREKVATVRVAEGSPVRVEQLEAFGVQPVTLSLVPMPAPQLTLPAVSSVSSQLEVKTEIDAGIAPRYRFLIQNRSAQPVISLSYTASAGTKSGPLTGGARKAGRFPVIPPGETYVVTLAAAPRQGPDADQNPWVFFDQFKITAVLWGDGVVEGDPGQAAMERALDEGSALQLTRALKLLRTAAAAPAAHGLEAMRDDVGALTIEVTPDEVTRVQSAFADQKLRQVQNAGGTMRSGMQNVKNAVRNDIDAYAADLKAGKAEPYSEWLATMLTKYDGWRQRIAAAR